MDRRGMRQARGVGHVAGRAEELAGFLVAEATRQGRTEVFHGRRSAVAERRPRGLGGHAGF